MGIFSFLKGKQQEQVQEPVRQEPPQWETVNVPASIDGHKVAYQYTKVDIVLAEGVDFDSILAQRIRFDNSRGPVALFVGGQYIGTVKNSKIEDMISDWLRRKQPIFAVVSRVDDDKYTAAFDLYLYRNEQRRKGGKG